MAEGKCPLRAPTKNNREETKIAPFRAPNVEQATKNGTIQDITPRSLSPKVCKTDNHREKNVSRKRYSHVRIILEMLLERGWRSEQIKDRAATLKGLEICKSSLLLLIFVKFVSLLQNIRCTSMRESNGSIIRKVAYSHTRVPD